MLKTTVEDLGLVEYSQGLDHQLQRLAEVQTDPAKQYIIVCSHPPVATLGRKTTTEDYQDWQGDTFEVQRGGRVTYHGPHQVVVYPIINLSNDAPERNFLKARDLHGYLRKLEQVVIDLLAQFELKADRKPLEGFIEQFGEVEPTGVWIENRKICSVGIGVKKWTTLHGLAINVSHDENAFSGLRPCGFTPDVMTSLEKELGRKIEVGQIKSQLLKRLETQLG